MKIIAIVVGLALAIVAVLWYADTLAPWSLQSLIGNETPLLALLLCIPISLTLFVFLSHRQAERLKVQKHEERKIH